MDTWVQSFFKWPHPAQQTWPHHSLPGFLPLRLLSTTFCYLGVLRWLLLVVPVFLSLGHDNFQLLYVAMLSPQNNPFGAFHCLYLVFLVLVAAGELVISLLINHCSAEFCCFCQSMIAFKPLCNSDFIVSKAFFSLSVAVTSLKVPAFGTYSRLSCSLALNLNFNSLPHFLKYNCDWICKMVLYT